MLHPTDDVIKATIIPRKGALGFVAPRPGRSAYPVKRMVPGTVTKVLLVSYAAETIKYSNDWFGVSGDFQKLPWIRAQHGLAIRHG